MGIAQASKSIVARDFLRVDNCSLNSEDMFLDKVKLCIVNRPLLCRDMVQRNYLLLRDNCIFFSAAARTS